MDAVARVTTRGRVTVPRIVRDALRIRAGDRVVFRIEGQQAILTRTPDFLELEGSVPVPEAKRGSSWDEVLRRTRSDRADRWC